MGLLDEAIREHLELKRRNGGDPGELARKENEALAPVLDARAPADAELGAEAAGPSADEMLPLEAPYEGEPVGEHEATYAQATAADALDAPPVDPASIMRPGEETAELDMEAVLAQPDEASEELSASADAGALPVRASATPGPAAEDALEWEMPGDRGGDAPPAEIPGQERLTFE